MGMNRQLEALTVMKNLTVHNILNIRWNLFLKSEVSEMRTTRVLRS